MEASKLSRRQFLVGVFAAPAEATAAPAEPTAAPVATEVPAEKPTVQPTKQGFTELQPPPEAPPFEGGPQWTPKDLNGKELVLWGLQYDPHVERYNILAETFSKRTGAKVTVQPQEWPIDAKVMAALAAGTPPDVICWMGVQSAPIVRQQAILPIDDVVFSSLGLNVKKWWMPGAIGAYYGEGQHWGVPVEDNQCGYTVTARIDLIEQAGDAAKALWPGVKGDEGVWFDSYEDMWALAELLQQKDEQGNVKIWGLSSDGWDPHSFISIMRNLGTEFYDAENDKFNMDNEAAVEAVRLMVEEPYKRGIEGMMGMGQIDGYVAGQVALARGNASTAGEAYKMKIAGENVIAPSAIKGQPPLFYGEGGWGFEIPSEVKDKELSAEFLRFMCTYEAQYIFSQIYGGSPPATRGIIDSDIYKGDDPIRVGLRRGMKAQENTLFWGWGLSVALDGISEALSAVREGKMKGPEAAKQMQEAMTTAWEQWKSEA